MTEKRLYRSREDRVIAGVCGGLARYLGWDPSLVRVGWVVLTFFAALVGGVVAYVVLAFVVPEEPLPPGVPPASALVPPPQAPP